MSKRNVVIIIIILLIIITSTVFVILLFNKDKDVQSTEISTIEAEEQVTINLVEASDRYLANKGYTKEFGYALDYPNKRVYVKGTNIILEYFEGEMSLIFDIASLVDGNDLLNDDQLELVNMYLITLDDFNHVYECTACDKNGCQLQDVVTGEQLHIDWNEAKNATENYEY